MPQFPEAKPFMEPVTNLIAHPPPPVCRSNPDTNFHQAVPNITQVPTNCSPCKENQKPPQEFEGPFPVGQNIQSNQFQDQKDQSRKRAHSQDRSPPKIALPASYIEEQAKSFVVPELLNASTFSKTSNQSLDSPENAPSAKQSDKGPTHNATSGSPLPTDSPENKFDQSEFEDLKLYDISKKPSNITTLSEPKPISLDPIPIAKLSPEAKPEPSQETTSELKVIPIEYVEPIQITSDINNKRTSFNNYHLQKKETSEAPLGIFGSMVGSGEEPQPDPSKLSNDAAGLNPIHLQLIESTLSTPDQNESIEQKADSK